MSIDTEYQTEPVCPYCGACDYDWWEDGDDLADGNSYERSCGSCGEDYRCSVSIPSPRFTTTKKDER